MHRLSTAFVLAYHGCEKKVGEAVLSGGQFKPSTNDYDWLGHGIYFWESNPGRAWAWAHEKAAATRDSATPFDPLVVGAVIDLGSCLDLSTHDGIDIVRKAHQGLVKMLVANGSGMPVNSGGAHRLDCAVMQYAIELKRPTEPIDSIRAVFQEGEPIYPSSRFQERTHIQICVVNPACIKGVFRL